MGRRWAVVAVVMAAAGMAAVAAACDGTYRGPTGIAGGPNPPPDSTGRLRADVVMMDSVFVPGVDTVPAGRAVTWQNYDSTAHSVTAAPSSRDQFDSGGLPFGGRFEHTFALPGTYQYYDRFNGTATSGMRGTIVVQ